MLAITKASEPSFELKENFYLLMKILKMLLTDTIFGIEGTKNQIMTKKPCLRYFCQLLTCTLIINLQMIYTYIFRAWFSFSNFSGTFGCM